jgi:hypothetical protein
MECLIGRSGAHNESPQKTRKIAKRRCKKLKGLIVVLVNSCAFRGHQNRDDDYVSEQKFNGRQTIGTPDER